MIVIFASIYNLMIRRLLSILLLALPCLAFGQIMSNDECVDALVLSDITDWCSTSGQFSNVDANISQESSPGCFSETGNDVWFQFDAASTSINIRVLGDIVDIYGITDFSKGSIILPKLALYEGSCGNLNLIACNEDQGDHIAELYSDEIIPNATYFIRVSSATANAGTFQLCISSFNFVPEPNSDCPTGVILCDKSSFFVDALSGQGNITNEVNASCVQVESGSAWYKWVAGSNGSLGFVITPNNPGDDIDFALFEMPNGITDCSDLIELRCMASGANGEQQGNDFIPDPFPQWDECTGPTGLSDTETDFTETPGCTTDVDNNFVASINMEAGKAYALIINNFSATGHGFSLEFGGTGDFLGPVADFSTDDLDGTICSGEPIIFFDESSFGELVLVDWQWNFGDGAIPQTASGPGPHQVQYSNAGVKSVALTVESETGCLVTEIGTVIVEEPIQIDANIVHQTCPESIDGQIELDITSGSTITAITWSNGMTGPLIQNLSPGVYTASIQNFNGCDTIVSYEIEAPLPLSIDQIITRPSCGGGSNGSITLVVDGQAPPFVYDYQDGNGFVLSNTRDSLVAGIYTIDIRDNNGCITTISVPLGEIDIDVDSMPDPITPPSCFGFSDGQIELVINGGNGPYMYDWNLTGTFLPTNVLSNISAGPVVVAIRDAAGCLGFAVFDVPQPDSLIVNLDTIDISCFGMQDGMVQTLVFGGTNPYNYNWSNGTMDTLASGLSAGQYAVTVTDNNGCQSFASASIEEPPELFISLDSVEEARCFGEASGAAFVSGFGGNGPYQYQISGRGFQDTFAFNGLVAGSYTVTVRDDRGCTKSVAAVIGEPEPLLVSAGQDTTVNLGFTTQLLAAHQPPSKPVSYSWTPAENASCDDCPFPVVRPTGTTTFQVTVVDDNGCAASDNITVFVFLDRPVFIPNAITPNGDGFNDQLHIFGGPAVRAVRSLKIFSRWGEMVYSMEDFPVGDGVLGWDGTHKGQELNPGVFAYVAEIEFIDEVVVQFEGDITLIR